MGDFVSRLITPITHIVTLLQVGFRLQGLSGTGQG